MPDLPTLGDAIQRADLAEITALLDAGAQIHYRRPSNYDALIDAVYTEKQDQIVPILRLLIDRGADLNCQSDYGESALSVMSCEGRWDVVQLLLDAGADPAPLQWSPLMRAIALGSLDDVKKQLQAGGDLSARDFWSRTPWLLSLQCGDVAKAKLLLSAGASLSDRGRCGKPPLMYPLHGEQGDQLMLKWLLTLGLDPNDTDEFGTTPLIEAASLGLTECVRILLASGADIHSALHGETAIKHASNLGIVRLLIEKGDDINHISDDMRRALTKVPYTSTIDCTLDEYLAARTQQFGIHNPEKMNFPFWRAMVCCGRPACEARQNFGQEELHGPPVWCFHRFGRSINELPDGRIIEIAGEHEDFYDPDFCIYNDVFVYDGKGNFDIFGYPREVFPPTDFHSATLVGRFIYIIGCIGYVEQRRPDKTPVYRLNIDSMEIEPLETTGDNPGWISEHTAVAGNGDAIEITGGSVYSLAGGKQTFEPSRTSYRLNVKSLSWTRLEIPSNALVHQKKL